MMVTVEGSYNSGLSPLLSTLEDETSIIDDRVDAYLALTDRLRDDEHEILSKEICSKTSNLVCVYERDMLDDNNELSQAALQSLGFCVHHQDISKSISQKDSLTLVKALCNTLLKTTDKSTCTRALWCIAKQNFPHDSINNELHGILCAVEHALVKGGYQSMSVEHEAINAIITLLEQLPNSMKLHALRWGNLVLPLLLHSAHKIRERALHAMRLGFSALMSRQQELVKTLVSDIKSLFSQEMTKLFENQQELHVLTVWQYLIDLLGKALHKGGSLINSLLTIVERAFKSSIVQVKCAAFHAWQHLIDNFALDMEVLCNHKRMKLLLQPFKVTVSKQEAVAVAKLDAWWHFAQVFENRLAMTFDQICVPLLQFSLGLSSTNNIQCPSTPIVHQGAAGRLSTPTQQRNGAVSSPGTPYMNLAATNGSMSPVVTACNSLQMKGCEILAHLLRKTDLPADVVKMDFTLGPLKYPLINSSSVFIKVSVVLIHAVRETMCSYGNQIPETLVTFIWQCLSSHMKTLLDMGTKKDTVEIFTLYLASLQAIINSERFTPTYILKLIDIVSKLPQKALSSPAYHVGNAELMHGTPALFLIQQMFHYSFLENIISESYFCILEHLVERGMSNPTAVLGFAQSVLELLNTVTVTTDNSETIWRIWSIVVNPMLQHVVVTNEVNQGDSLDHDFSAMYIALVLPVKKLFISNVTQGTMKTLLKTWSDIYNTFARCCALVATADANVCCQDLCTKILQLVDMKILKDMRVVDALGHLCGIMLSSIDFSSYSYQQSASSNRAPFNPGNPTKKRYKHLGNITAFIQLVKNLLAALNTYSTCQDSVSQKHYSSDIQAWSSSINGMTNLLSTLFSHITMATMIQSILEELSQPIAALFVASSKPQTLGGLFTPAINQKLEKLWGDLLMLIESRHKAPFSTHFLKVMSPLLEVTLSDCKRSIRNRTVQFWNATFACADTLSYSDSLKTCLLKVKETTAISLPDIDEEEDKEEMEEEAEEEVIQIVEETPYSLGTDTEPSQVVVSRPQLHSILPTFGRGSPQKLVGSFLKKTALSPDRGSKLKRSPLSISKRSPGSMSKVKVSASKAKVVVAPSGAHARRKLPLSIDEDSRQVFVAISPSPKHKKFVLTEHQKEVLRSRKVVPTMYNDLDASLDTSYMAELLASQTQEFEPCDDEEVASTQAKRPRLDEENIDVNKLATQSFQKEKNRVSFAGLLTKSGSESASSDVEEKEKNARRVKLVKVTDSNTDNTRSVSGIKGINTAVKPLKGSEIDHKLVEMTQKLKESPKKQTEQTLSEEKESEKIGDNSKRKEIYNEEENVLDSTNEDIIAATPPPTEAQTISDARRRSLGFRASHPASDPAIKTSIAKKRKLGKDTSVEKSDTQAKSVPETQELRNSEVDETEVKTVPDSQVKSENMLTATSLLVDKQKLLTTPVLKLKRLSQEEIKKYSPKKAIQSESIPSDKQAEDKENSIPDASREIERTKMEDPCGDVAQDEPELQKRSTPRRSLLGSSVRSLENKDDIEGVVPFPEQQTRKEGIQVESGNEMPMDLECAQINSQDYVGDVSSQDSEPLVNIQRKRRSKKSDKVNVVISSEDSQEDMTPRRSSRRSTSRKSLPTVEEHSETVPSSWKESSSNQIPERRKSRRLSQYSEVEKDKGVSRSNKVMKGHSSQERESQFSQNVEAEQVDEKSKTISSENADEILTFASPSADEEEETEIFFRIDPASLEVDSELSDVEVLPVEDVDKSDIPKTQELKKPDTPPESDSEEATVEISNKNKNKMADKTPTRKSTRIVGKKNKRSPQQTIAKKLLNKVMKSPREKSATRLTNKRTVGSSVTRD
uniref:Telomere-associated protein RIF1-like n=1 Tax=Saccoglossus kowalevskii TaxID=10224 RepID=A0ABM0MQ25_SACKO|nr:PREDICTED: telomere-associated protein RIF1-like [Saccoglossus kowalevskii]